MPSKLSELMESVSEFSYDGKVLVKLCFGLIFYSLDMATPEQKEAVLRIFDEYAALYGSRFSWTANPQTGAFRKLKKGLASYVTPHDWLLREPQDNGYIISYHAAKTWDGASDVFFRASGENLYGVKGHDLSILACLFPLRDVLSGSVNLPELFYRWCGLLKPHHAHGGYCLNHNQTEIGLRKYYSGIEAELLFRFPGLQYFDSCEALFHYERQSGLYNGPCCADWLIALSDPFVEKLGGVKAIAKAMHPLPWQTYEGGVALQAGAAPGLGENGDAHTLPDYVHLAKVIEPVRVKRPWLLCVPVGDPVLQKLGLPPGDPTYELTNPLELTDIWTSRFSR